MILVVLGTHELPFTRLLEAVEEAIEAGLIQEDVIVQVGHTPFNSKHMKLIDFTSYDEMDRLYDEARVIITHGGTGSITSGLKKGKTLIAAPRLIKYGEHNDDHQLEIVNQFSRTGHLIPWTDEDNFEEVLQRAAHFTPQPFYSGKNNILSLIESFIDENVKGKN
ncbi:PssE/Cps14G family polysaccharide biosynthesis glycosyltransferase [Priestia endophytica]|uniref:PssE/Cps14G family polysaccharide biosynthesis glycosyltransferase n=1 Tax=Priestia endophytica TaxID=135735 RepID=UPI0022828F8D|nr:PssE/Cps14G family polysaccharide biosynthesis glycosyltransferase [Priestia endophytica]MCY8231397.1 exopolysaccharide biosynthesis protein [Priestia endophytica]